MTENELIIEKLTNDTFENRWRQWAEENNICYICGSSRDICGGEEKHG